MPYFMGCHWYNCTAILRFDSPPEGAVVCPTCGHRQARADSLSGYFATVAAHAEGQASGATRGRIVAGKAVV